MSGELDQDLKPGDFPEVEGLDLTGLSAQELKGILDEMPEAEVDQVAEEIQRATLEARGKRELVEMVMEALLGFARRLP